MQQRCRGFTLIELLVVVTIGAVMAGLAVLSLGRWGDADAPREQLQRLVALLEVQCEQALFQSRPRGIRLTEDGYDFWQAGSAGWVALPDQGTSRQRRWPEPGQATLFLEGRRQALDAEIEQPQIICQPLGEITSFELELRAADRSARLSVSAGGRIELSTS